MAKQLLPPTENKLMAKIDVAVALVSVGVIVTCAITLAVLSTLPKKSLPNEYGYGGRIGYGYGYGATAEFDQNLIVPEPSTLTSTTPPFPESASADTVIRQY